MSNSGSLSAALAFVPNWWQETTDAGAFDRLLRGWAQACGWRACGFVWPGDNSPAVVKMVQGGNLVESSSPPELPDAVRRLRGGEETVTYSVPGTTGRVFAAVQPTGRPLGVLWAERVAGQPWTEAERAYLVLTAKTMERSPAVAAVVGPVLDPDKLYTRLGDAAVIAGRMAHDFDNILTGIIGFSDLTLPLLPAGSQAANFVGEIGKVGQRGIQFTQQLHQLSRSGQVKPQPAAVHVAVAKEEARLKPAMNANVRIEKDLPPGLPAVALEAGPLQAVLGHVLENAVEACSQGGLVRVTARQVELNEAEAQLYLGKLAIGPHLQINVNDTGTRNQAGGSPPVVCGTVLYHQGTASGTRTRHRLSNPLCSPRRYSARTGPLARDRDACPGGAAPCRRPSPG